MKSPIAAVPACIPCSHCCTRMRPHTDYHCGSTTNYMHACMTACMCASCFGVPAFKAYNFCASTCVQSRMTGCLCCMYCPASAATASRQAHLQDVEQHHFITGWASGLKLALRGVLHNRVHCLWCSLCIHTCRTRRANMHPDQQMGPRILALLCLVVRTTKPDQPLGNHPHCKSLRCFCCMNSHANSNTDNPADDSSTCSLCAVLNTTTTTSSSSSSSPRMPPLSRRHREVSATPVIGPLTSGSLTSLRKGDRNSRGCTTDQSADRSTCKSGGAVECGWWL